MLNQLKLAMLHLYSKLKSIKLNLIKKTLN